MTPPDASPPPTIPSPRMIHTGAVRHADPGIPWGGAPLGRGQSPQECTPHEHIGNTIRVCKSALFEFEAMICVNVFVCMCKSPQSAFFSKKTTV